MIGAYAKRTLDIARNVLADAGMTAAEVRGVVLVGGSTRVPLVRSKVADMIGKPPLADIDPDEVVALGAALQAEALTGGGERYCSTSAAVMPASASALRAISSVRLA